MAVVVPIRFARVDPARRRDRIVRLLRDHGMDVRRGDVDGLGELFCFAPSTPSASRARASSSCSSSTFRAGRRPSSSTRRSSRAHPCRGLTGRLVRLRAERGRPVRQRRHLHARRAGRPRRALARSDDPRQRPQRAVDRRRPRDRPVVRRLPARAGGRAVELGGRGPGRRCDRVGAPRAGLRSPRQGRSRIPASWPIWAGGATSDERKPRRGPGLWRVPPRGFEPRFPP